MVDIIIPTYMQEKYTILCLESIRKHTYYNDYRIIWVDNGSTRKSRDAVYSELRQHQNKRIIWLENREGFISAVNIGLNVTEEDVIILNNDTIVTNNWLHYMQHPTIWKGYDIIGCNTTMGTSRQDWKKLKSLDKRFSDMPDVSMRDIDIKQQILEDYYGYKVFDMDMVAFFCVYITRECLLQVGNLDKKFKEGYSDDKDFCIRAKALNLKIGYTPSSYVHHYNNTTFKELYTKKELSNKIHNNRKLLRNKHGKS